MFLKINGAKQEVNYLRSKDLSNNSKAKDMKLW